MEGVEATALKKKARMWPDDVLKGSLYFHPVQAVTHRLALVLTGDEPVAEVPQTEAWLTAFEPLDRQDFAVAESDAGLKKLGSWFEPAYGRRRGSWRR